MMPTPSRSIGADAAPARTAVSLARLSLSRFRCYRAATLEVDARPVVLTGPNGAGKTNLLEAISLLAPGRGLRRARLDELDRRPPDGAGDGEAWAVAARLKGPAGTIDIGTGREPGDGSQRRTVKIDGRLVRGQRALAEVVSVVWLVPAMDRLLEGGAGERRRFLDRLVYGFDAGHADRVAAYDRALSERARLLRADGPADAAWLAALEAQMAQHGIAIAAARREVAARLDRAVGVGPFPKARLAVVGPVEAWLEAVPALAAEETLAARLAESRGRDRESGGAAWGPHRADLKVDHPARGLAAAECSTGEQKALLISILLAHARAQGEALGSVPLLLLDEVAAHLDALRRAALFEELVGLGGQSWLTGTDEALFEGLGERAQFCRVRAGTLALAQAGR